MKHLMLLVAVAMLLPFAGSVQADEKPIKVLLVTGGGYHDYATQMKILKVGLESRGNIKVTVKHLNNKGRQAPTTHPAYEGKDWAKGYDVVLHNTCNSADTDDPKLVENIAQAHRDQGVPALFVHCAMHCFRPTKGGEYQKMIGLTSKRHERHAPIKVTNKKSDHPIMKKFPKDWTTPKGELYRILKLGEKTEVLAIGVASEKKEHPVIWAHQYGKGKVFGTTIGHHNETMKTQIYLDLLTRAVLWSTDKIEKDGSPKKGYGPKEDKAEGDVKQGKEVAKAE